MIQPLKLIFNTTKGDNTYTIKLPTVGQFYDIEVSKQVLGKGFYGNIAQTNTLPAQMAADMIDIEAHLSILCPDLLEDLKAPSFKELGLEDYNQIKKVFVRDFLPWWNQIQDILKVDEAKK